MAEALPKEMNCVVLDGFGGPEVLKPGERPVPSFGAEDVLIKVAAAGVNRPDVLQRQGSYTPPPGASDLPGLEVAGTIVAIGSGVKDWKVADSVMALVSGGGYAEYCAAPAPQCLPVPQGFDMVEAAGVPADALPVSKHYRDVSCMASGSCAVQEVWREMRDAIEEVLKRLTLAELIERQESRYGVPIRTYAQGVKTKVSSVPLVVLN